MPKPWPVASRDSDFDSYLGGMPETSVRMFRRFTDMVRTSGPVTLELQNGPIVLRGTRRIFGSVCVLDNGLRGHLNLTRRVNDPRLVKVEALTKSLVYHRYLLTSISDLDGEFQRWLDEAHSVGDGARFLGQPESVSTASRDSNAGRGR
jgi:hypothetical protein